MDYGAVAYTYEDPRQSCQSDGAKFRSQARRRRSRLAGCTFARWHTGTDPADTSSVLQQIPKELIFENQVIQVFSA